jgi:hypothetical protein
MDAAKLAIKSPLCDVTSGGTSIGPLLIRIKSAYSETTASSALLIS